MLRLSDTPQMSVVVVESGPGQLGHVFFDVLRPHLASGAIEIVAVTRGESEVVAAAPDGTISICCPDATTVPRLRSAGMKAARGEVVALTESFCVPSPQWVPTLLDAFREGDPTAVGGPVDRQAGRAVQWALTFCEYGRFFAREEGPTAELAGINVAYHKERLKEALGSIPEEVMEMRIDAALRRSGSLMLWTPDAVMFDDSDRDFAAAWSSQYRHGRFFGGQRVMGASPFAKLTRALLSPLVPPVLLLRISKAVIAAGRGPQLLRSLAPLVGLLAAWTLGEATGSLLGEGESGDAWL